MANYHFVESIYFYPEIIQEIYEYALHYFRLCLGFHLGYSFVNYQSFLDWSLTITAMNFIFIKVITEILHQLLPESMHDFLYKDILAEVISLGLICLILQQSLMFLFFSRLLYTLFCFYSYLFSRLILESIAIGYYLKSAWYLLPVSINILISLLYLMDMSMGLEFFFSLLELSFVQGILQELGIRTDMFLNYKMDLGKKGNQYHHLIMQDEEFFNQLKQYYLNSISKTQMKIKMNEFKQELIELYHQKPAVFIDASEKIISLPLEWSYLSVMLKQYPENIHINIFKAYYSHPFHTMWRLMNFDNPWLAKDSDSWKNHKQYHQPHYQEMLLLMWFRAKKLKSEFQYIQDISRIYRRKNQSRLKFRLFDKEFDNHQSDMPDTIEHFQNYVLHHLEACTEHDLVTEGKIKKLWKDNVKNYWKEYLNSLSKKDFFELRYIWKEVLAGRTGIQEHIFKLMDLDEAFKDTFLIQMKERFGDKWKDFHSEYVNQLFNLSQMHHCHVEKFTITFSTLMKTYFKEELPKRIAMDTPRFN